MMLSLSAYPTDSYFDPSRPSWLPYWIDTPTESALKYGAYPGVTTMATPPPPPGPAAPPTPNAAWMNPATSAPTVDPSAVVDDVIARQAEATKSGWNQYMADQAAAEATRQQQQTGFPIWAIVGIAAVGVIALSRR